LISEFNGLIACCSLALSVKMSILLYIPGILVLQTLKRGLLPAIIQTLAIVGCTQILLARPFIETPETAWAYIHGAFEFSRVFLYKWTVNWRFVSEDTFISREFAYLLLFGHICTLLAFAAYKWCDAAGGPRSAIRRAFRHPTSPLALRSVDSEGISVISSL
jgi:alpha-1,3-mannosyltransferase